MYITRILKYESGAIRPSGLPILCLLAVAALTLASCGAVGKKQGAAAAPAATISAKRDAIPVQTLRVQDGSLKSTHAASGTVVAVTESKVAAQVSGIVEQVTHLAGTWVAANDVVVTLDDSQFKLAVESAQSALQSAQVNEQRTRAELDLAQLTLQRDQPLLKSQYIPQSKVDSDSTSVQSANGAWLAAKASVGQAQAALDQAQLNLDHTVVRAPFAGQIAAMNVTQGEFVGQNSPVFDLVSPDRQISFSVPPSDAAVLSPGAPVTFTVNGASYPARISRSPSAPVNGVVPMVGTFSPPVTLAYGLVGKVTYGVSTAQGSIVPVSAVQTTGDRDFVYIIDGGKAVAKTIQVISESGTDAAVSGLTPGDVLILNPPPGLIEGAPVQSVASHS